jgi:hypothetical protein
MNKKLTLAALIIFSLIIIAGYFFMNKSEIEKPEGVLEMVGDTLVVDSSFTVYQEPFECDSIVPYLLTPMLKWSGKNSEYPYDWLFAFFDDMIREDSTFAKYLMVKHKLTYYTKEGKSFGYEGKQ